MLPDSAGRASFPRAAPHPWKKLQTRASWTAGLGSVSSSLFEGTLGSKYGKSQLGAGGGRLTPQEVRPGLGRCGSPCHWPGRSLSSPGTWDPLLCRDIEGVLPPAWGLCARMAYRQGLTGEGQRHFRGLRGPHCSQKAGALPVRHPHRAAATLGFHSGRLWG